MHRIMRKLEVGEATPDDFAVRKVVLDNVPMISINEPPGNYYRFLFHQYIRPALVNVTMPYTPVTIRQLANVLAIEFQFLVDRSGTLNGRIGSSIDSELADRIFDAAFDDAKQRLAVELFPDCSLLRVSNVLDAMLDDDVAELNENPEQMTTIAMRIAGRHCALIAHIAECKRRG